MDDHVMDKEMTAAEFEALTAKDSRAAFEALQAMPAEVRQRLLLEVDHQTHSRMMGEGMAAGLRAYQPDEYDLIAAGLLPPPYPPRSLAAPADAPKPPERESAAVISLLGARYEVWSYENANLPERGNYRTVGRFYRAEPALAAARQIVDAFIAEHAGQSAEEIRSQFLSWGDVPVVQAIDDAPLAHWDAYAYLDERLGKA